MNFDKKQKIIYLAVSGLVLLGAISWLVYVIKGEPTVRVPADTTEAEEQRYYSQLDGTIVSSTEAVVPRVLAVMIDNHTNARPQSGIADARIVYEAPAEGGITRYLAIFNKDQNITKVGPIRSARPYYLDWVREFGDPPYMHVGGSPEGLRLIKQFSMWDADQFFWPYYWRSTDRLAPHNVYTSSEYWDKLFVDYGDRHPEKEWAGWKFNSASTAASSSLKEITITYNSNYIVSWKLDEISKRYARYVNGHPYIDFLGKQVMTDNLLIQNANVSILDDYGRKEIDTVGGGEARMVVGGALMQGTWKKDATTNRTRFYDESGKEAVLNPGQTWVQVVPSGTVIEIGS